MANKRALVVDDEPDIRELLEITLHRMGVDTHAVASLAEARKMLGDGPWDLCLTDMRLPDGSGIDLVRDIASGHAATPVAVITAYGSMDTAIDALKAGAFDFVSKPVQLDDLRRLVDQALRLEPASETEQQAADLVGRAPAIDELRRQIAKVARSQAPVAISGESGTGKELAAQLIHAGGPRADKPFVPINCGAIPAELMESEFFGHRRGAFTGAVADKAGLFATASGGTLFLDEIGELPAEMQVKLLRAIQDKRIRPVGATAEEPVDVRILSATHQDLDALMREGRFREDLYYRINVIALRVPPLRERAEDIPLLAERILARIAADYGRDQPRLTADAVGALADYPFPGNVRELENILERAMALAEGAELTAADLRLPEAPADANATAQSGHLDSLLLSRQKQMLTDALERYRWNRTEVARQFGLTYRQLRYRLKKLGID